MVSNLWFLLPKSISKTTNLSFQIRFSKNKNLLFSIFDLLVCGFVESPMGAVLRECKGLVSISVFFLRSSCQCCEGFLFRVFIKVQRWS